MDWHACTAFLPEDTRPRRLAKTATAAANWIFGSKVKNYEVDSTASTIMRDPCHPEVKAEMYRLQVAPQPWRKQSRSAHAVSDLEYFFLVECYSKYIGESLDFLKSTWHRREKRQGLSWGLDP